MFLHFIVKTTAVEINVLNLGNIFILHFLILHQDIKIFDVLWMLKGILYDLLRLM